MMVERHYDDEALIALMEAGRLHSDAHLPSCPICNEKVDSFQAIAGVLRGPDVWDRRELSPAPVESTIASLRAFADRMASEDAVAARVLPELLAGPREEWMPRLRMHPEWRTAGVVRKLVAATTDAVLTMPPDALEMALLSTEIADHLDPSGDPSTAARLRGSAWRDRAYALYYVGRFADALAACDVAEAHFEACVVDEYDRARVGIIRSLSLRAKEDLAAAMDAIQSSTAVFARFEDVNRFTSAKLAETHLFFDRGEFPRALSVLQELERSAARGTDARTHAIVLSNLGYCLWKLGRVDEALGHHDAAASLIDDLGMHTESARIRWNVASILVTAGRTEEARGRLESLRDVFRSLGMTSEVALVSLDLAELCLARGQFGEVEAICRAAMKSFEVAGISYTGRALTALAYMQEAARLRTATPVLVKHVREYIRRLPQDEHLLFAPPPDDSSQRWG
jgi:tetratricopeptide (TPR) repeat protein